MTAVDQAEHDSSSLVEDSFGEHHRGTMTVRSDCESVSVTFSTDASSFVQQQQPPDCPWWVDTRNPYIGTFRHAPRAEPPSRHIERGRTGGQEPLLPNAR